MTSFDTSKLPAEFGQAVNKIRSSLPPALQTPTWGIICGSGLSTLGSSLAHSVEVPYSEIPGFSSSSVVGHKNSLAFGFIEDGSKKVPVVAALGRFHLYEGYTPQQCVFPIRVMKCLGIKAAIGESLPEHSEETLSAATLTRHPTLSSSQSQTHPEVSTRLTKSATS